jgi:hypothetical protein
MKRKHLSEVWRKGKSEAVKRKGWVRKWQILQVS